MKFKSYIILIFISIAAFTGFSNVYDPGSSQKQEHRKESLLKQELAEGEALVWYLFHSGWVIKTKKHFLIFDYWRGRGIGGAEQSLENGSIDPDEIKDLKVVVFVSHSHGDHYDRVIHEWEDRIDNIKYVFGWKASNDPKHYYITKERESMKIGDVQVDVVNHSIDGVPEAAFLVRVDGLTVYHSGDHGFYKGSKTELYESNIDYLAGLAESVDLAFIMAVDGGGRITKYTPTIIEGAFYTADKLNAKVLFPMHGGGFEHFYREFYDIAESKNINATIYPASKRGDVYHFKGK
ncbi:MBL fold metallo-hydrolase [candidate division KSB1 bacterium]